MQCSTSATVDCVYIRTVYAGKKNRFPIGEFQFYGIPLMDIAAVYYWIAGNGDG